MKKASLGTLAISLFMSGAALAADSDVTFTPSTCSQIFGTFSPTEGFNGTPSYSGGAVYNTSSSDWIRVRCRISPITASEVGTWSAEVADQHATKNITVRLAKIATWNPNFYLQYTAVSSSGVYTGTITASAASQVGSDVVEFDIPPRSGGVNSGVLSIDLPIR